MSRNSRHSTEERELVGGLREGYKNMNDMGTKHKYATVIHYFSCHKAEKTSNKIIRQLP